VGVALRRLGRTGLAVSEIGFGCGTTADLMINGTPEMRRTAVARALELGINYFDTAPVYGDTASETNLGQALRELGARPIVATKVALAADDFGDICGAVIRSVEASLGRLGLDALPLVQLHNRVGERRASKGDFGTGALLTVEDVLGPRGVLEGFLALRKRGLVHHFGCSAYGGEMKAVQRIVDNGAFDAIIVNYSVLNRTAWKEAEPQTPVRDYGRIGLRASAAGMGAIALRVLEGGILAGDDSPARRGPDHEAMTAQARALRASLTPSDPPPAGLAIRFALSNREVSTVLVGFSDIAQIDEAVRCSAAGPLPADLLHRIEGLRRDRSGAIGTG
jgi:aryl-alcohol dehydrogenase-like predicted oxidoreductase